MSKKKWLVVSSVVLIGVVAGGAIVYGILYRTLPGDNGYGTKVNYIEEILEYMRPNAMRKAEYHLVLMERRLSELTQLVERESFIEGDLWYLKEEIAERSNELIAHLAQEEGEGLSVSQVMDYTHRLATVLRALEITTEENVALHTFEESFEDVRRGAQNLFNDRAEQFVVRNTEDNIKMYITALLERVLSEVEAKTFNRKLKDDVGEYIGRAQRDIGEKDAYGAIKNIGTAYMLIRVAEYLGTTEVEPLIPNRAPTSTSTNEGNVRATGTEEARDSGM